MFDARQGYNSLILQASTVFHDKNRYSKPGLFQKAKSVHQKKYLLLLCLKKKILIGAPNSENEMEYIILQKEFKTKNKKQGVQQKLKEYPNITTGHKNKKKYSRR